MNHKRHKKAAQEAGMLRKIKVLMLFCFTVFTVIFAVNLFLLKAKGNPVKVQTDVSGAELFTNNCARCHGADGTGGKGPDLTSEKRQAKWKESDEKIIKKITKGGFIMPSFGKKLKPEEIRAIAAYVRTLKQ